MILLKEIRKAMFLPECRSKNFLRIGCVPYVEPVRMSSHPNKRVMAGSEQVCE
jgi:hypothetical protein